MRNRDTSIGQGQNLGRLTWKGGMEEKRRMKMRSNWRREENQERRARQKLRKKVIAKSREASPVERVRTGKF